MFRPTWPSSGVYDVSLFIPEGICFAAFVARGYTMQFLICVFCCVFVRFLILVCVFAFLPFLVVCRFCVWEIPSLLLPSQGVAYLQRYFIQKYCLRIHIFAAYVNVLIVLRV
jgi:hypothetical protein